MVGRIHQSDRSSPNVGYQRVSPVGARSGESPLSEPTAVPKAWRREPLLMSSRPEDSHPRALLDPYVNLSIHTAPMFGRFHDRAASGRRVLDLPGGAGQTSLVPPWSSDATA